MEMTVTSQIKLKLEDNLQLLELSELVIYQGMDIIRTLGKTPNISRIQSKIPLLTKKTSQDQFGRIQLTLPLLLSTLIQQL